MKWYLKVVINNYANFSGRARRQEYWMFILFNIIFALLFLFIGALLDLMIGTHSIGSGIYVIYLFAIIIPWMAVIVRRLHDIGKSGAWFLISFVPFIGGIWSFVLMCTEGEKAENKYGEDPKQE